MEMQIFLTDYASYNEGTQMEFGHWVDLTAFSDGQELRNYIDNHFKECDRLRPLGYGNIREEIMITDYEGLPSEMYSECGMDWDAVIEFVHLNNWEQAAVVALLENGHTLEDAMDRREDMFLFEANSREDYWTEFEELYPDAVKASNESYFIKIDIDAFIDAYNEVFWDGVTYAFDPNY